MLEIGLKTVANHRPPPILFFESKTMHLNSLQKKFEQLSCLTTIFTHPRPASCGGGGVKNTTENATKNPRWGSRPKLPGMTQTCPREVPGTPAGRFGPDLGPGGVPDPHFAPRIFGRIFSCVFDLQMQTLGKSQLHIFKIF